VIIPLIAYYALFALALYILLKVLYTVNMKQGFRK